MRGWLKEKNHRAGIQNGSLQHLLLIVSGVATSKASAAGPARLSEQRASSFGCGSKTRRFRGLGYLLGV